MITRILSRFFILSIFLLTACSGLFIEYLPSNENSPIKETLTPFQPQPAPPVEKAPSLWIDPEVPGQLRDIVAGQNFTQSESPVNADFRLETSDLHAGGNSSSWIYVLVAPFPTVRDSVTFEELKNTWSGNGPNLVMVESTRAAMRHVFNSDPGSEIRIVSENELNAELWRQPDQWGIVPFEMLEPEMKVLEIDQQSPIHQNFDESAYPLKIIFTLNGMVSKLPASNRDATKLTTVLMTGTTALVRATSYQMQQKGIEFPARDVIDWLRNADILHISNEVSFTPDCPPPDPKDGHLRFCSAEENIGLLDAIGVDVIEVSGNHVKDWGSDALLHTLELYRQRGWQVFAGSSDLYTARQPAIIEHGGTRFAFVGCNAPGPDFAWANESSPGAAPCQDYKWLVDEIRELKNSGAVVIVGLQDYEYYTPEPRQEQIRVFRKLADAGADVVSGSQAHYPQAMEFYNHTFIHYGLGNLFFDQMEYYYDAVTSTTDIRREFMDRHVFYNGKHISTELLTATLEDYAKPRPMGIEERQAFLTEYFLASGW